LIKEEITCFQDILIPQIISRNATKRTEQTRDEIITEMDHIDLQNESQLIKENFL